MLIITGALVGLSSAASILSYIVQGDEPLVHLGHLGGFGETGAVVARTATGP
jgi:NAD/NADP transhydrogenase beta subunit